MNPAKIQKDGSNLLVDAGTFNVLIPEMRVSTYERLAGKDVVFGIRPENIHNPLFAPSSITAALVDCKVDVTELMGNEILLYMLAGDNPFVARVDPRSHYKRDDEVQMVFNMDKFHIFDPSEDKENPVAVR